MYDAIDSDAYQNMIIYPAGNKVAISEPYVTGYRYFSKCCEHARLILAIGYSFRDYDTVSSIIRATEVNEGIFLSLLSPNAWQILNLSPSWKSSTKIQYTANLGTLRIHLDISRASNPG